MIIMTLDSGLIYSAHKDTTFLLITICRDDFFEVFTSLVIDFCLEGRGGWPIFAASIIK